MLPYIRFPKHLSFLPRHFGIRYESSATPAPGRIYSQRHLLEVKKTMMKANNPEKYALSSDFLAHRADRPKDYKALEPPDLLRVAPSPLQKKLLFLTRIYKHESDIPEVVSELDLANMKERLNFMVALFCVGTLFVSVFITTRMMKRVRAIVIKE